MICMISKPNPLKGRNRSSSLSLLDKELRLKFLLCNEVVASMQFTTHTLWFTNNWSRSLETWFCEEIDVVIRTENFSLIPIIYIRCRDSSPKGHVLLDNILHFLKNTKYIQWAASKLQLTAVDDHRLMWWYVCFSPWNWYQVTFPKMLTHL